MRTRLAAGLACLALVYTWRPAAAEDVRLDFQTAIPSFTLEPFHPDIKWSGRVNTIAVHPTNPQRLAVATESGGVFQSLNGGRRWFHADGLPVFHTVSVAFLPTEPRILLATATADFKTANGGGVWRSEDHGFTWTQAFRASNDPSCRPTDARPDNIPASAWDIAIEPETGTVYVGTDCGLAVSADGGLTWTRRIASNSVNKIFRSVEALGGGRVVAVGGAGAFYSEDGGETWRRSTGLSVVTWSWHALSQSPLDPRVVYAIDGEKRLVRSRDGGASWAVALPAFSSPPAGRGNCGGVPFVKAVSEAGALRLYAGNECSAFRAIGLAWSALEADHDDARDLAFVNGRPAYLATDGGFHLQDESGRWVSRGGGSDGLNALQLYEVTGQKIFRDPSGRGTRRHDLYIGTQDNDLWSSDTGGRTWPYSRGAEGFSFALARAATEDSDSRVLYTACASCNIFWSKAHFRDEQAFPDATDCPGGYASIRAATDGGYVQHATVRRPAEDFSDIFQPWLWKCYWPDRQLYVTENDAVDWRPIAEIPWKVASRPRVSWDFWGNPVVYMGVRMTDNVYRLVRQSVYGETTPLYPGFRALLQRDPERCGEEFSGHAGLGRRGYQFVWETVFGVDPEDPMHLIAPDPSDDQVKESWNGGECWAPMPGTRELVTRGGALASVWSDLGKEWASLVSAVSFYPQNPLLALMGAREGGLYFSHDRGRSWQHVPGSERIPNVTSFEWKSTNEVFVSSYGRGLWRLRIGWRARPETFADACGDACLLADVSQPDPRPFGGQVFDGAVLLYEGRMMDAQVDEGLLRGISVTPGTAWILTAKPSQKSVTAPETAAADDPKDDAFPVAEIDEPGEFKGLEVAKKLLDQGWLIKGLAATGGKVTHVIVTKEETVIAGPGAVVPFVETGVPDSALVKRQYVTADFDETTGAVTIGGTRFRPRLPVVVMLDGRPVKTQAHPNRDGSFTLTLHPRLSPGQHVVRAGQKHGKHVLSDTTSFEVPTADGKDDGKKELAN